MEIFLEFLKYGAIGIAMVLVVLSYRLLSKEQEKENVREPMLKSIKTYFILAIALAVFFGIIEIVSLTIAPGHRNNPNETENEVKRIYVRITNDRKTKDIGAMLDSLNALAENGFHSSIQPTQQEQQGQYVASEITALETQLQAKESLLFKRAVLHLEHYVASDPTNSINVEYNIAGKSDHFKLLEIILDYLGAMRDDIQDRTERLQKSWKAYKEGYKLRYEGNNSEYILPSDIEHLKHLH